MKTIKQQFVVNPRGEKTGILLDLKNYRQLIEDLHDLQVIAERKTNPKLPSAQFLNRLKKHGRL